MTSAGIRLLTTTVLVSAISLVPATAATAAGPVIPNACLSETDYSAHSPLLGWRTSNTASDWLAGPGTIEHTVSATATTTLGGSLSGGVSFSGSLVVVAIEQSIGLSVDLSVSASRSSSWTYSTPVPAGKTARVVVSERGYRANVTKYVYHADCSTSTYTGSFQAPYTSFTPSTTCLYRDIWPATSFQTTTGGCQAET